MDAKQRLKIRFRRIFRSYTQGCYDKTCTNPNCARNRISIISDNSTDSNNHCLELLRIKSTKMCPLTSWVPCNLDLEEFMEITNFSLEERNSSGLQLLFTKIFADPQNLGLCFLDQDDEDDPYFVELRGAQDSLPPFSPHPCVIKKVFDVLNKCDDVLKIPNSIKIDDEENEQKPSLCQNLLEALKSLVNKLNSPQWNWKQREKKLTEENQINKQNENSSTMIKDIEKNDQKNKIEIQAIIEKDFQQMIGNREQDFEDKKYIHLRIVPFLLISLSYADQMLKKIKSNQKTNEKENNNEKENEKLKTMEKDVEQKDDKETSPQTQGKQLIKDIEPSSSSSQTTTQTTKKQSIPNNRFNYTSYIESVCNFISTQLSQKEQQIIISWISRYRTDEVINHLINPLQKYITIQIQRLKCDVSKMNGICFVLEVGAAVSDDYFYNEMIQCIDLGVEYKRIDRINLIDKIEKQKEKEKEKQKEKQKERDKYWFKEKEREKERNKEKEKDQQTVKEQEKEKIMEKDKEQEQDNEQEKQQKQENPQKKKEMIKDKDGNDTNTNLSSNDGKKEQEQEQELEDMDDDLMLALKLSAEDETQKPQKEKQTSISSSSLLSQQSLKQQVAQSSQDLSSIINLQQSSLISNSSISQSHHSSISAPILPLPNIPKYYPPNLFTFLQYPFLFKVKQKEQLLHTENMNLQDQEFHNGIMEMLTGQLQESAQQSLYLKLSLQRDNIIQDALFVLENVPKQDLKKKLKVKFDNEDGIDEGGVMKEFFVLICRQLFDMKYGMFTATDNDDDDDKDKDHDIENENKLIENKDKDFELNELSKQKGQDMEIERENSDELQLKEQQAEENDKEKAQDSNNETKLETPPPYTSKYGIMTPITHPLHIISLPLLFIRTPKPLFNS
ncbi:MAG: hypothetical protein EZS28_020216 [Streblomastix strix]|uniref:HECT-type E3 ubiquitin transferase n=1 Tax=Streblomastix strix TaxID=222440 RepID=A0A5J4VNM7_9EUKA|nr:MAG: hypothetical protein EZS28_020216 [Streblomastix strix]